METQERKKAKTKTPKIAVSVYLDNSDLGKLGEINAKTGASLSFLIRKAVKFFLKSQGA